MHILCCFNTVSCYNTFVLCCFNIAGYLTRVSFYCKMCVLCCFHTTGDYNSMYCVFLHGFLFQHAC